MSFEITYLGHSVPFTSGDTVLEALERLGIQVPSSCRAGACQSCVMRAVTGNIPRGSQDGLRETLRQTGHFLSCICRPTQSMQCEPANIVSFRGTVEILEVREIGPDTMLVRFCRPSDFLFTSGQFATFTHNDNVTRSYSIASRSSCLEYFDIHVRCVPGGILSGWFHKNARPGDSLWMEGPKGDCIYVPGNPEEPLTLVGAGTGIAPLFAIAESAASQGHQGKISIYHGAISEDRFYWCDEVTRLVSLHDNFDYSRCVVRGPTSDGVKTGDLNQIVLSELTAPQTRRVYLCGDPSLVKALKKSIFLAGVSLSRIHADPFVGTEK